MHDHHVRLSSLGFWLAILTIVDGSIMELHFVAVRIWICEECEVGAVGNLEIDLMESL